MRKDQLISAQRFAASLLTQIGLNDPIPTEEGIHNFAKELGLPTPVRIDSEVEGWMVFATITPEMAEAWMLLNIVNRPLDQAKLAQFADDIAAGAWSLTHQGIAFNGSNQLFDGQHRLLACIAAKASFGTFVYLGLREVDRLNVDTGKSRSAYHQASLLSLAMTAKDESIARLLACGIGNPRSARQMSHATVIGIFGSFKDSIAFATKGLENAPVGARNAAVHAAFAKAHASGQFNEDQLKAAMEVICDMKVDGLQPFQPITRLKIWLLSTTATTRKTATPTEILCKSLRALVALQHGEQIGTLHPVTEDPYPMKFSEADDAELSKDA